MRARGNIRDRTRARGEQIHCETITCAGLLDAAHGNQSAEGECRLGYVIGITSSTVNGPRHILQWPSKFTRNLAKGSLGGEVNPCSETIDRAPPLREFHAPVADSSPGAIRMEDCGSPFTDLKKQKTITEEYLARQPLGIQQSSGNWKLSSARRPPGLGDPADGLIEVKGDVAPPPRLWGPLRGISSKEREEIQFPCAPSAFPVFFFP